MTDPELEAYGPPASPQVKRAVAPFFSDEPVPVDPDVVERINRQIRDREATIPWKRKNT